MDKMLESMLVGVSLFLALVGGAILGAIFGKNAVKVLDRLTKNPR